jgi:dimethylhistidine N-methyltransferase
MNTAVRINPELVASATAGLSKSQKTLEAKWFYDCDGSALFEKITDLPEYYPTRTELQILKTCVGDLATGMPDDVALVELGSGASTKTRILLDQMPQIRRYMPIDISEGFLAETARGLAEDYPRLPISPVAGDFMAPLAFPSEAVDQAKVAFFPGSTLGNLEAGGAVDLLARVRAWPQIKGFVLGVDLVKAPSRLIAAYDDSAGVTAAFNLNILHRLNREACGTIDVAAFDHEARWNAVENRIEMHLVARSDQEFLIDGVRFQMVEGESIHTENSHKYTQPGIKEMAAKAGWDLTQFHSDPVGDFAVCLLTPS